MSLRVSDHALLRFLERGGNLDIEGLRAQLEASLACAHVAARSISNADYLIKADGLVYLARGDTVVTVLEAKDPGSRAFTLVRPTPRQSE